MGKSTIVDGVPHRMRRGRLVAIPAQWLGKVPGHQTINARPAKGTHKARVGNTARNTARREATQEST